MVDKTTGDICLDLKKKLRWFEKFGWNNTQEHRN